MADGGDVTSELLLYDGGGVRVLDEDEKLSRLGVDFNAREVFQAAEGEVEFEGFELHIVAHFENHGLQCVETIR